MFDLMTNQELDQYIGTLTADRNATFGKMMDEKWQARISVFSDEWAILSAHHADIIETHIAALTEQVRRNA